MVKHSTPQRADITLRATGTHVHLSADQDLAEQARTNRRISHLTDHAANILFVNVRAGHFDMRVEADALVLRFFKPKTEEERKAIQLAERLVIQAARERDVFRARVLRMQANEILWTTISKTAI